MHTVTFGAVKPGLVVGRGPRLRRRGAPRRHRARPAPARADRLPAHRRRRRGAGSRRRRPGDDKYSRGVVGVVAGSATYPGAGVLCTGAALRTRPGLVRYAGTAADGVRAAWPEAIVTGGRPGDAGRVQAWVVGPGHRHRRRRARVLAEVLATDLPVVVDADALTCWPATRSWSASRRPPPLLTPHDREFERFGEPVGADRIGAARRLAADLRCSVLLKGDATVVAEPDGPAFVNGDRHPLAGHRRHRRRALRDRRRRARHRRWTPPSPAPSRPTCTAGPGSSPPSAAR